MRKETRTVVYDEDLHIEAYRFEGIIQPFPNHFHEYFVIGYIESGERSLSCKTQEYTLSKGDIVLFNPGDSHACVQTDGNTLDYRSLNISQDVMLDLSQEVTGERNLPGFSQNVLQDEEITCCLRILHERIMNGSTEFDKEESLLLLISLLIQRYGQPFTEIVPDCRKEIEKVCLFIEQNYNKRIYLDQLCSFSGLSKSTLLRAFTKSKGITPYRYLENIRITEAKKLLEQGIPPVEAAIQTGFSDQSHFTNYFNSFIGLSPGNYRDIFLKKNDSGGPHNE